jgi:hypothetical protein
MMPDDGLVLPGGREITPRSFVLPPGRRGMAIVVPPWALRLVLLARRALGRNPLSPI